MGLFDAAASLINNSVNTGVAVVQAKKNRLAANKLRGEGETLLANALKNRKDYQVAPEVQGQYDRDLNALGAKSQIQSAMETQADTGVSNVLGAISRNSTSGAGAIAAAQGAEAQRQAGYQAAAVAGAGDRDKRLDRLGRSTELLADKKDTAYDLNVQQMFESEYNRAQDMIGAGYQGQIGARQQAGQAWTEGISAAGQIAQGADWSRPKRGTKGKTMDGSGAGMNLY